jgi:hypothetical protein
MGNSGEVENVLSYFPSELDQTQIPSAGICCEYTVKVWGQLAQPFVRTKQTADGEKVPHGEPHFPTRGAQNQLSQFDSEHRQSDRKVASNGSDRNVLASTSIDIADQKLFALQVIAGRRYTNGGSFV